MSKVSQYTSASPLADVDTVYVVQSGNSRKATISQIATEAVTIAAAFTQSGTGASARTVQSKERDIVSIKDFGALGDGIDDTTALNAAFAQTGKLIYLPKGNYKVTSNPTEPVCSGIIGEGENNSIITAAAGVTRGLLLGSATTILRDFQVVGNATASAIGILFGNSAIGAYDVSGVLVQSFTGTSSNGVKVSQAVKSKFKRLTVSGCTQGMLVDATGGGGVTTCDFDSCVFRASTGIGMKGVAGNGISFINSIFESNGAEGAKIVPDAGGTAVDFIFDDGCWFEANWGATSTEYQFVADAASGPGTVRFKLKDASFHSSGAKSIKVSGSGCTFLLDNPQVPNSSATILIQTSAAGICHDWPSNLAYNTCVSDTARTGATLGFGMENLAGSWVSWTPTFASSIGNAAATFTGAVTINVARARYVGKTLTIQLQWGATLLAVTPSYISFTLPSSLVSQGTSVVGTGTTINNGTTELGLFIPNADGTVRQFRMAGGNFTSGGVVGGTISMDIETT